MLKTLIKKQYMECFRTYFVNRKTGKRRSKGGIIGMFVMFACLMLFLCAMFFGLSLLMGEQLFAAGLGWLFYVLMGSLAVMLGVFGSVFNTYSTLYLAKDNELLLSMPIPPSKILITRMLLVYGLSLLYSGCIWIPTVAYGWIFEEVAPLAVVFQVLLLPIIALLDTVITCVLGWAVALVASRVKNKSFIAVLASLVFFGAYYYVSFNMMGLLEKLLMNAEAVGKGIRTWANILYQLGMAANGSVGAMLIFSSVSLLSFAICLWVLSRTFLNITIHTQTGTKRAEKVSAKAGSAQGALRRRELRRFLGSATYMLNCGLGVILLILMAGFAVIKREVLLELISGFAETVPQVSKLVPLVLVAIVGFCVGMNAVTVPSVSLEGKNLWIVQSLPVTGKMVLRAKLGLGLLVNLVPAVLAVAVLSWCVGLTGGTAVLCALLLAAMTWFFAAGGLMLGVLRPDLQWTSESMPIKQSLNMMLAVLFAFVMPGLIAVLGYLTRELMEMDAFLAMAAVVLLLASAMISRWLDTAGARRFERL